MTIYQLMTVTVQLMMKLMTLMNVALTRVTNQRLVDPVYFISLFLLLILRFLFSRFIFSHHLILLETNWSKI